MPGVLQKLPKAFTSLAYDSDWLRPLGMFDLSRWITKEKQLEMPRVQNSIQHNFLQKEF